jgi:hypothetical protein
MSAPAGTAKVRVEWAYPSTVRSRMPLGFHVYAGISAVNYSTPVATVLYANSIAGTWGTTLTGLSDDTTYTIGVRAFNATAEEPNTTTVTVTADSTGPAAVDGLTAIAI